MKSHRYLIFNITIYSEFLLFYIFVLLINMKYQTEKIRIIFVNFWITLQSIQIVIENSFPFFFREKNSHGSPPSEGIVFLR